MRRLMLLAAVLLAAPATAKEIPEEVVKYRQLEMGAVGRHFGAVKRIVKGEVDRPQDLLGHTAALVELAKDLPSQFPEGTGPDSKLETEALKKVWTDSEGFAKVATDFEAATVALNAAAEKRDMKAVAAEFEKTGELCGTCHDSYTKE